LEAENEFFISGGSGLDLDLVFCVQESEDEFGLRLLFVVVPKLQKLSRTGKIFGK